MGDYPFTRRLRARLEESGLTKADFVELMKDHASRATVYRWLDDDEPAVPSMGLVLHVLDALRIGPGSQVGADWLRDCAVQGSRAPVSER
jgi:transcriptional regulator with XRE-family HTH domain